MNWRDRIVEVKRMKVRDILAHERNPRLHSPVQKEAVKGLLNEVGKADVLRAYTGADGKIKLWDGHLRQGLDPDQEWWVAITDLTEAEAKLMLVAFDPIAALAEQDAVKLEELLRDVNVGDAALQQMLTDMAEDAGIVPPNNEAGKDTEPEIDKAEELRQKWGVEPGQLWQLGDHRLICGDCTDKATVERVMGGERAQLLIADPEYDAPMDWMRSLEEFCAKHWLIMAGDRQMAQLCVMYPNEFNQFFVLHFRQFSWNLNVYIPILTHLLIAHLKFHEAKSHHLNGLHSVLESASKFDRNSEHPHAKRVELIEPLLGGFTDTNDVVMDVFSGSGTAIIACENLGRKCRSVEISSSYVAVALERWSVHTGKTPALLG